MRSGDLHVSPSRVWPVSAGVERSGLEELWNLVSQPQLTILSRLRSFTGPPLQKIVSLAWLPMPGFGEADPCALRKLGFYVTGESTRVPARMGL